MKDLYESLHEAHKLDEATSSDWFSDMKKWLQETNADEEKFFWSDHHEYVDEVYGQAIEKVSEEYNHLNIGFEFSTQAGRGMCEVFGNDDEGSGYYRWDFEEDREDVFEIVNESENVEELLRALVDYLSGKVECINWEDNSEDEDDYDDYDDEDVDESLRSQRGKTVNEAVKKDTKNTKIERPKGYKGTVGGYLSIDRYGTFVSRKTDSGGVQISSANYDWIKDNFDLVEQPDLEYKTMWGRGVVYKIVEKK